MKNEVSKTTAQLDAKKAESMVIVRAYQAMNPTPETAESVFKQLAEQYPERSTQSVRQVLVTAKVYVKPLKTKVARTESGEVVTKDDLAEQICSLIGYGADSESLAKANKGILTAILAKLQG